MSLGIGNARRATTGGGQNIVREIRQMPPQITDVDRIAQQKEIKMTTDNTRTDTINVPEAPAIEGLVFRHFRGEEDFSAMAEIIADSREEDQLDFTESADDLARNYRHLTNCDPAQDMVFAEVAGKAIGYGRVFWAQVQNGPRVYALLTNLTPTWRGKGIRRAMLHHCERRNREIAADQNVDCAQKLEAWASDTETDWRGLLEEAGYQGIRFGFQMIREHLDGLPDLPLPDGLIVREITAADYREVWSAAREAFRDHWGFSEEEWNDEALESWMESDIWQPHLWQVAWDGDEVAGMVLNFIDAKENEKFHRKRGYTETICVRRPWRRRGLARALIARSIQVHKEQGMTETALGVDAENPNAALQLYESMGYKTTKRFTTYRKPIDTEPPTMGRDLDDTYP